MLKSVIAVSLISLSSLANVASAYSLVSYRSVAGTVTDVNHTEQTLTIKNNVGASETFAIAKNAKVSSIGGKALGTSDIKVGSLVTMKASHSEPIDKEIKGEVISVNPSSSTIKILQADTQNIVNLKFDGDVVVSGQGVKSLQNVRQGHELIVRYQAN